MPMPILLNIFAFLLAVFILVVIHEWGHFWVAKRLGVKVLRFSVGFGKSLWRRFGKDGTEYVIAMIPLGGYVKMLDEREAPVPESEKHLAFNNKPVWARIAIVLAGPLVNLLFAVLVFWVMYTVGITQLKPIIGEIIPDSIAAQANLKPGEQVQKIDGHTVFGWPDILMRMMLHLGDASVLQISAQSPQSKMMAIYQLHLADWKLDPIKPEPLKSLGIKPAAPFIPAIIYQIQPDHAAANAGLQIGDKILSINGKLVPNWLKLIEIIQDNPAKLLQLEIERNNQKQTIPLMTESKWGPRWKKIGFIGAAPKPVEVPAALKQKIQFPFWVAWVPAIKQTWLYFDFNRAMIEKMLMGALPMQTLGGPISIYQSATLAFHQGVGVYIGFLAVLSVMLAFINLLPIPGLDGGHLLFSIIEIFLRRPVSIRFQVLAFKIGIILLLVIFVHATINDLVRVFSGG